MFKKTADLVGHGTPYGTILMQYLNYAVILAYYSAAPDIEEITLDTFSSPKPNKKLLQEKNAVKCGSVLEIKPQ